MSKRLNNISKYSIRDLERLSGIKAHTLRIWEKRYQLVSPKRTPTNIRYYSDDDLKKILNVSMLNQAGIKISNIASLSNEDLCQRIEEYSVVKEDHKYFLDQLVFAMIDMDDHRLEEIIDRAILEFGLENAMMEVVYPFFKNVGIMWLTGTVHPGQEHCISNIVRRKLILAIDRRKIKVENEKKVVFFLPNKEWHELGLLFYHFVALGEGVETYYLGQSVPLSTLQEVVKNKKPTHLVFSHLSVKNDEVLVDYMNELTRVCKSVKVIFLDSSRSNMKDIHNNVLQPKDLQEFKELIKN